VSSNKYSVRLLEVAEQDLQEIVSYVAGENVTAALALADRIEKDILRLAAHPYMGRIPDDDKLAGLGYRFLVVENYLIFYTVGDRTVLVHRIIHGARDIPQMFPDS
jgi:toxin ParE1/3/4